MLRIVVVTGGTSNERGVAIASAARVVPALRSLGHSVDVFDAATGNIDTLAEPAYLASGIDALTAQPATHAATATSAGVAALLGQGLRDRYDVAFLALHGGTGEDGQAQTILAANGIPFTGSDSLGCAITMDKDISKRLFRDAGIPTPEWVLDPHSANDIDGLGYPVVIKPVAEGSSLGLTLAQSPTQADEGIRRARKLGRVMAERFIPGRELTVGVVQGQALPVLEVQTDGHTAVDYLDKYSGKVREAIATDLAPNVEEQLKSTALEAHSLCRLGSYSRADFRLDANGVSWLLEVNSAPGLTDQSLLPMAAEAAAITFPELCEQLCQAALRR